MKKPDQAPQRGLNILSAMRAAVRDSWAGNTIRGLTAAAILTVAACHRSALEDLALSSGDAGSDIDAAAELDAGVPPDAELDAEPEEPEQDAGAGEPPKPEDEGPDSDGDGFPDREDVCSTVPDMPNPYNSERPLDTDDDGVPNACDNCVTTPNIDQVDSDMDGTGDACDTHDSRDRDADDVLDAGDNCEGYNPGQVDADGDGVGVPCDPDDSSAAVYPGAPDLPCDGVDSNGDGIGTVAVEYSDRSATITGEPECDCVLGHERETGNSTSPCVAAIEECRANADGSSEFVVTNADEIVRPANEGTVCDEEDNDCDGLTDEGLRCPPPAACEDGEIRACGSDTGDCEEGTQTCNDGVWSTTCEGATGPTTEVCDGRDNNCNSRTDEGFRIYVGDDPEAGQVECNGRAGVCQDETGHRECVTTASADCSVNPGRSEDASSPEICDHRDNSCNGEIDETAFSVVGRPGETGVAGTACSAGQGVCATDTVFECAGDRAVVCPALDVASSEVCGNEADEDCDGQTNEGCDCNPGATQVCGTDAGACVAGEKVCTDDGHWPTGCPDSIGPSPEVCSDRSDNDCDGQTNEDCECNPGDVRACGTELAGHGECRAGTESCVNSGVTAGRWSGVCGGTYRGPATEVSCPQDGLDEDCDDRVDEPIGDDCQRVDEDGRLENGEFGCNPVTGRIECMEEDD